MSDAGFVIAAYAVILGGLALYTITLARRLASARRGVDRDDEAR
jgi:hypothetical protein